MTLLPKKKVMKRDLEVLLLEARRLANQTVQKSDEVAVWHRKTDRALQGVTGDDPDERYDAPAFVDHRALVDRLFFSRRTS